MPTEHKRSRHFNISLVLLAVGAVALVLAYSEFGAHAARSHHGQYGAGSHGYAALCDGDTEQRFNQGARYVEEHLDLRTDQEAAWAALRSAAHKGMVELAERCDILSADGATVSERLALSEEALIAGTAALRTVRPAFDEFYAVLDEQQRRDLEAMTSYRSAH